MFESSDNEQEKPRQLGVHFSKCHPGEIGDRSAIEAVQVFGGPSFNCEYPVEKLIREAKILQIYEEADEIHWMIIACETYCCYD